MWIDGLGQVEARTEAKPGVLNIPCLEVGGATVSVEGDGTDPVFSVSRIETMLGMKTVVKPLVHRETETTTEAVVVTVARHKPETAGRAADLMKAVPGAATQHP